MFLPGLYRNNRGNFFGDQDGAPGCVAAGAIIDGADGGHAGRVRIRLRMLRPRRGCFGNSAFAISVRTRVLQ